MKKNSLKILIIFALFLFSYTDAMAACSWQEQKIYFDKTKGAHGETVTTTCSAGTSFSPDNKCTTQKPEYTKQSGVSSKAICCCSGDSGASAATASSSPKFKLPDYKFQIPIGDLSSLKIVDCSNGTCEIPFLAQYISAIYKYGLSVAGVIGVLMLMGAGLLWLVSGGDSGKINQAKKMIFGSIFGLTLLTGLTLFLSFINPDLAVTRIISLPSIQRIDIEPESDTDISVFGGTTIYKDGCDAARKGDLSICRSYGKLKPANTITVAGINGSVQVDNDFYKKYLAALECVKKKNGGKAIFGINEAFRDAATQIKYWESLPKGQAATPCCSNHSNGQAVDINRLDRVPMSWAYNESSGLRACMEEQKLFAKIKRPTAKKPQAEAWHWSLTGH